MGRRRKNKFATALQKLFFDGTLRNSTRMKNPLPANIIEKNLEKLRPLEDACGYSAKTIILCYSAETRWPATTLQAGFFR